MKKIELDLLNLESKGYISQDGRRKGINEQYRAIKRTLINTIEESENGSDNMIMVTSTKDREGKTFNAINLALSIAFEKDKTVLLVDANVINPGLDSALGFESENGMIEYLRGDIDDISELLLHTNINNLKIIPAGKPSNLTNELLASDRMKRLTQELSERYSDRVIIFDAPSLLDVTETPIIANLMNQALIIVEENVTNLSDLNLATADINPDLSVGVIMNKSTKTRKSSYMSNKYNKKAE